MRTKKIIILISASIFIIGLAILINTVSAEGQNSTSSMQYPVKELGNCESESACKTFCDEPKNAGSCLNFASENNLMSEQEIQMARKFLSAGGKGPGGCKSKNECEEYCNDISHINECVTYAEENNLMSLDELKQAKQVQEAISKGIKPPACQGKEACDEYCDNADHMEECVNFAAEAGFIEGKELEDARKILQAVKNGVKPLPCRGKEACDEFCSSPDNMELCINFAIGAGLMTEQEKADSEKMLEALKKGVKPLNCRGKDECDAYCQQEEHLQECLDFSVAAGFMSAKGAEIARKTGGKGPGGCKNKEECDAFCNNPDNQQTCFEFGKENGLIPPEQLKEFEEGNKKFQESLNNAPPKVKECLTAAFGDLSNVAPSQTNGEKMKECFEKFQEEEQGKNGNNAGPSQGGPGGCQSPEECDAYCKNHQEECQRFQGPTETGPQNNNQPPQNFQPPINQNEQQNPDQIPPDNTQPPLNQNPPLPVFEQNPINQILPENQTPPAPKTEQQASVEPAPPIQQAPIESPTSLLNISSNDLLGSAINAAVKLLGF